MNINFFYKILLNLLIISSMGLLLVGIFAPLMTLEKFYFWENNVSLYTALQDLVFQSEWVLFWIIFIFSIIFPIIKSLFLLLVLNIENDKPFYQRLMKVLSALGKWSMLDVFVVALLLVTVKLDVIANVQIHYGIFAFGASVFLTMILTHWINWLRR